MKQPSFLQRCQYALEYCGARALEGLIRLVGIRRGAVAGAFFWRHLAPFARQHRQAHANLKAAYPDMPEDERVRIVSAMWDNLGATFAEAIVLDQLAGPEADIQVNGLDMLQAQRQTGKGLVMVSLHAGNFEALGVPLAQNGLAVAGMYQKIRNPLVEAHVLTARERFYTAGLFAKGAASLRQVMVHVRHGGIVAILADQRTMAGISVPFFGRPAPSNPFPAMLARRLDVPIIAARCRRLGPARFAIDLEAVDVARDGSVDADVEETTARIQARFEAWIRECPEQWMWGHRRWSPDKA
ncbi:MAG: lysophospholipid acyltransferase family protein [Hyphomicrobiaceae bacterium]|nr:lysophospholipid acyltransferase family protein [Hyphomicrobiaceae bacterium]